MGLLLQLKLPKYTTRLLQTIKTILSSRFSANKSEILGIEYETLFLPDITFGS